MKYDYIIFTPFHMSRLIGAYKVAKILRDQGYNVKVIDFLHSLLQRNTMPLLLWLDEHIHQNTVFCFSGTFMDFAIVNDASKGDLGHGISTLGRRKKEVDSSNIFVRKNLSNFVEDLKSEFPDNKIIVGGVGFNSRFLYNRLPIDHLFIGYGEDVAKNELVDIFKGKEVPAIIDSSPFDLKYDFHNSGNTFHESDIIFPHEVLPLEISRGCRFACKFCSFSLIGRKVSDKYIRHKDKIFDELMHNYELFGTSNYNIVCDTFNETNEKLLVIKEVFDEFNKITGEQIQFNSYIRLELANRFPEQISMLRDMGVAAINLGIETLHYPSAKAVGKGIRTEDVYKTVSAMRKSWGPEARIHSGFIIGLPHETRETATEWLTSLYNKELDLTSWKCSALRINPDKETVFTSVFDREADKYGYKFETDPKKWKNEHWSYEECDEFVVEWTKKFIKSGVVKQADHPWGYLNFKNGIIKKRTDRDIVVANEELVNGYIDRLLQ